MFLMVGVNRSVLGEDGERGGGGGGGGGGGLTLNLRKPAGD